MCIWGKILLFEVKFNVIFKFDLIFLECDGAFDKLRYYGYEITFALLDSERVFVVFIPFSKEDSS